MACRWSVGLFKGEGTIPIEQMQRDSPVGQPMSRDTY
jgi:hypothetical protein